MDFILHLPADRRHEIFEAPPASAPAPGFLRFEEGKAAFKLQHFRREQTHFYVLGDCILPEHCTGDDAAAAWLADRQQKGAIHELKGFFYLILVDFAARRLEVHSSFLNILPIYYHERDGQFIMSSSLECIVRTLDRRPPLSKRYVAEKLLFNYAFSDHTPYSGVYLAPSCHYFCATTEGMGFQRAFALSDCYTAQPKPWRGRLDDLSDLFIAEMLPYIPAKPFALTLTGGFDGRTVLSLARYQNASFSTFSYGLAGDPDVRVPAGIGQHLGFEHRHFDLGAAYAKDHFWADGKTFISQTEGAGNIGRAHYVQTARQLAPDFPFLLSGNFGSEMIRSMKDPGVMASPVLFALFAHPEKEGFLREATQYPSLMFIDREQYAGAIAEAAEAAWEWKAALPKGLTVNQQFHLYMFGEVFRKYFGPEIVMQSNYLCHRAPFLSFSLLKGLLATTLAGANSDFREKNPFRRFHGQVLYAHILKKTSPELLDILLDRGYAPKHFLTLFGPAMIAWGHFRRNVLFRKDKQIPSYSTEYYRLNRDRIVTTLNRLLVLHPPHWKQVLEQEEWGGRLHDVANALSLELYYQEHL